MSCESERELAYATCRKENVRDASLLRLFNKAIRNPDDHKTSRQALEELREKGFTQTAGALQSWLDCLDRSPGNPLPGG